MTDGSGISQICVTSLMLALTQIYRTEMVSLNPVIDLANLRKFDSNVAAGRLVIHMQFTHILTTLKLDKAGCSKCGKLYLKE